MENVAVSFSADFFLRGLFISPMCCVNNIDIFTIKTLPYLYLQQRNKTFTNKRGILKVYLRYDFYL